MQHIHITLKVCSWSKPYLEQIYKISDEEAVYEADTEETSSSNQGSNACFESVFIEETCNESDTSNILVEEADDIFARAGGALLLRSCTLGNNRHVFHIKGKNGKTMKVKKSLILWMISSGRFKRSNDRLRRFYQLRTKEVDNVYCNSVKQYLSIGDWVAFQGNRICQITNFQYKTGKLLIRYQTCCSQYSYFSITRCRKNEIMYFKNYSNI